LRGERLLLVGAPLVALSVVALGLRLGARSEVVSAIVFGAPTSGAGTGLAWQVLVFDEDRGVRWPVALARIDVTARSAGSEARWSGPTNDDGTAEVLLGLSNSLGVSLDVSAHGALLAGGDASTPISLARVPPSAGWAHFARREGAIAIDVAVLGQRVASGFPASIWVRASDAATHAPLDGVSVESEPDPGLSPATGDALTDPLGWAHLTMTTMGYGIALTLHARAVNGKAGDWVGALFASPGAAQIDTLDRYAPDKEPTIDIVMPSIRTIAYVEIDDSKGRAWGAAVPLAASNGGMPRASVRAPRLAPGLYWAVAASDPSAGAQLGPGTSVRPFFVAANDEAALAFGVAEECARPSDSRLTPRVVAVCLALAGATAVPRWTALDGFPARHARDGQRRSAGLAVALGAIAVAAVLVAILLLRGAHRAQVEIGEATTATRNAHASTARRIGSVGIAVLVALLGFALLAAFLVRAG
jgi:hypothetical protein